MPVDGIPCPGQPDIVTRAKHSQSNLKARIIRNWKTSILTVGGSERVRKKIITVLLYFLMCLVMAAVYVQAEHQHDRKNRILYQRTVHQYVKEISLVYEILDQMEWRFYTKTKINDLVELNYRLSIGEKYNLEAWNFVNAFVFCISTTTTIGYGKPSPNTTTGRVVTILLCITGIPFAFMALTDIVDLILVMEKFIWLMVKKKGMKPISKLQLYGRSVRQMFVNIVHPTTNVHRKRTTAFSAPQLYHVDHEDHQTIGLPVIKPTTEPSREIQTPVSQIAQPSIKESSHPSEAIDHQPQPSTSHYMPHESVGIEAEQDEQNGMKASSLKSVKEPDLSSPAKKPGWAGGMFSCVYENCCEELAISSITISEGEPSNHKTYQPDSREQARQHLQRTPLKTETVRKEVCGASNPGQVVDGEILGNLDGGKITRKNQNRMSKEILYSVQVALRKDLEATSRMNLGGGQSTHSHATCRKVSKIDTPEGLRFPKGIEDSSAGTSEPYLRSQYSSIDARIEKHRQEQQDSRKTLKNKWNNSEDSSSQPIFPVQMADTIPPGLPFLIEAGQGIVPSHDHELCNEMILNTLTAMLYRVVNQVKVELDHKPHEQLSSELLDAIALPNSANDLINAVMSTARKEVQKYVDQHKENAVEVNTTPRAEVHPDARSRLANHAPESPFLPDTDIRENAAVAADAMNSQSSSSQSTLHELNGDTRNASNSSISMLDNDYDNENENANTSRHPSTQSDFNDDGHDPKSGGHGPENGGTTNERASHVTIGTLTDEDEDDDPGNGMSLLITFINLLLYIFLGALMYVYEEDWDYLTSVYFIFTSIATIGFGDIMPTGGTLLFFWSSIYILFGLAFLAKVIQGIRISIGTLMTATVIKVEKAGVKMAHNLSHSFSSVYRADEQQGTAACSDTDDELSVFSTDIHQASHLSTLARTKSIVRHNSLTSTVLTGRNHRDTYSEHCRPPFRNIQSVSEEEDIL